MQKTKIEIRIIEICDVRKMIDSSSPLFTSNGYMNESTDKWENENLKA